MKQISIHDNASPSKYFARAYFAFVSAIIPDDVFCLFCLHIQQSGTVRTRKKKW